LLILNCYLLGLVIEQPAYQILMWGLLFPLVQWTMTVLLVSLYTNQATPLARALSSRIMVAIGLLSYSLYLWQGVVVFPGVPEAISSLCGSNTLLMEISFYAINFALAAASYLLIEKPFLRLKQRFSAATIAAPEFSR
jgi:peptidoglycan/LPS O-acetylase OafA/YrhL